MKRKAAIWIGIIILFVLMITSIRLMWMNYLSTLDYPQSPEIIEGVLDLRDFEFNEKQTFLLNGEWLFYPSVFLHNVTSQHSPDKPIYMNVPSASWSDAFNDNHQLFQYGTYQLRVLLDPSLDQHLALRISRINNAFALFINGELQLTSGLPSTEATQHDAYLIPYTVTIPPGESELNMTIHVSDHANEGGITRPIRMGSMEAVHHREVFLDGLQLLLFVFLLIHCLYAITLYVLGSRHKSLIYFSLLFLCASVSVLISDDRLLFQWVKIDHDWGFKLVYLTYTAVVGLLPALFNSLLPHSINRLHIKLFSWYCGAYIAFILIAPLSYIRLYTGLVMVSTEVIAVTLSAIILWKAMKKNDDIIFILLAIVSVAVNIVWSVNMHLSSSNELIHYPFDLIFALMAFAAFWFKQFFRATDQTQQLALKLQKEDKRKDEFLVNVSHELRHPLNIVTMLVQSLLQDQHEPLLDHQRKQLTTIHSVNQQLSHMLVDLMDVTRLKERTIPLQTGPVYIQTVFAGLFDMFRPLIEEKPITMHTDITDDFPAIQADKRRIIQIMFNLLHNAIKYTDEGTITIRAQVENNEAVIQIEDTGIGIPEDIQDRIFMPYEQSPLNAARGGGGFGLGLSICQQLVQLQGGTLSVQSQLGKGSIFQFTIPLADSQTVLESFSPLPDSSLVTHQVASTHEQDSDLKRADHDLAVEDSAPSKAKILAVDDDTLNLKTLVNTLEIEGYSVTGISNSAHVEFILKQERYDLVILDVMMPNLSGYEVTRIIRKRYTISELPILLLTTRANTEDILTGFSAGANDYVTKPIDVAELKARVHALTQLKLSFDERLRLESAWMQSQIQPHFLYNTLNSIAALGVIDMDKMQTLLDQFSNYLRLSFDFLNAAPLISLDHELSLVKSYLYIEKERFGDRLKVEWDLPDGIRFDIPPLSIQPLVENAIKHGITKLNRGGTIWLGIEQQSGFAVISVKDDGAGMDSEQLKQLIQNEGQFSGTSVGLKNINHRLKQLFGETLHIESQPNEGTIVTFRIPLPLTKE